VAWQAFLACLHRNRRLEDERGGPPKRNEALCGTRLRASASSGELLVLLGQQDGNDSEAGLALV